LRRQCRLTSAWRKIGPEEAVALQAGLGGVVIQPLECVFDLFVARREPPMKFSVPSIAKPNAHRR
jgi:hypothetical protein